jgi:hypothetical protein
VGSVQPFVFGAHGDLYENRVWVAPSKLTDTLMGLCSGMESDMHNSALLWVIVGNSSRIGIEHTKPERVNFVAKTQLTSHNMNASRIPFSLDLTVVRVFGNSSISSPSF